MYIYICIYIYVRQYHGATAVVRLSSDADSSPLWSYMASALRGGCHGPWAWAIVTSGPPVGIQWESWNRWSHSVNSDMEYAIHPTFDMTENNEWAI